MIWPVLKEISWFEVADFSTRDAADCRDEWRICRKIGKQTGQFKIEFTQPFWYLLCICVGKLHQPSRKVSWAYFVLYVCTMCMIKMQNTKCSELHDLFLDTIIDLLSIQTNISKATHDGTQSPKYLSMKSHLNLSKTNLQLHFLEIFSSISFNQRLKT